MINIIALHKLSKLRHSKMLLIFAIVCGGIGMFTFLPVMLIGALAQDKMAGTQVAEMYFGFAGFFGVIAAVLIGATVWRQDEKDGTMLTFMARPISRVELLLGKIIGGSYALSLYLVAVVVVYLLLHVILFRFSIPWVFILYLIQELLYYLTFFAAAAFFSSFLKPLMATVATAGWAFMYLLAKIFLQFSPTWSQMIGKVFRFLSPDLGISYKVSELLSADLATTAPLFKGIGYFALWTVLFVSAAIVLFSNKELAGRRS